MHLVAVSDSAVPSGAELVLLRALQAAARDGWTITCLVPDGPLSDDLAEAGFARRRIPELKLPAGRRPIARMRLALRWVRVSRFLRRTSAGADVVLCNSLLALPSVRLARLRPPVAWLVHDVVVRGDRLRLARWCAPAVRLAICVSGAVQEALDSTGMATRVVHNGTPWPVEPVASEPPSPPVIGCNGMLTSWKGQDVLLEAVALIPQRDVVVDLMGGRFAKDGAYVASLEARADQPDLAGRVRFLGHVQDPMARMRGWTMAVSSSIEPEAGPLGMVEAMSVGLPLIATDHGGARELVGEAALLVAPGHPGALAGAIRQLLEDPGLRRGADAPGPAIVAAGLTLDDQLRRLLDTLTEVAGSR